MKTEYFILKREGITNFNECVNEKLIEGWLLHGDTSTAVTGTRIHYIQAFIRQKK